jgi:hypothetical protein
MSPRTPLIPTATSPTAASPTDGTRAPARTRRGALLLAGLGLAGALAGCAEESQSGDSFPDRQQETVPVPGEASESPS